MRRLLLLSILICGCIPATEDSQPTPNCIVARYDDQTGRLADRYLFSPVGLVEHLRVVEEGNETTTRHEYDRSGRLVSSHATTVDEGGEPAPLFSWRQVMVYSQADRTIETDTTYEYDASTGHLRRVTTTRETKTPTKVDRWAKVDTYAYDRRGRKLTKTTTYGSGGGTRTTTRRYTYRRGRLHAIESDHPGDSRDSRIEFTYDADGRRIRSHYESPQFEDVNDYTYDDRGRLQSLPGYGGATFVWDSDDRLIRDEVRDATYSYDETGRLAASDFDGGGSYSMIYSSGCPAGFSHPTFTPNVDPHLYYEGRFEHQLCQPGTSLDYP